ncbi:MAG: protein kinase [Bacteroidetes bacterium]|nr:protein kinase [Fibrella sp.]
MNEFEHSQYAMVRALGTGRFGSVWLATHQPTGESVAIRNLNESRPDRQQQIRQAIDAVAEFSREQPHLVGYRDVFEQDGRLFLVTDYAAGGSLRQRVKRKKVQPYEALNWTLKLTETLAALHERGFMHNDVRPDNLFLTADGTLQLADLGLAAVLGNSPDYRPPDWTPVYLTDPRTDVFAVGVTLLEWLTGQNPLAGKTVAEVAALLDQGQLPIGELPVWQQSLLLKALQRSPDLRFATMRAFADALRANQVPLIIDRRALDAGDLVRRAEGCLSKKKWGEAERILQHATELFPDSVSLLTQSGQFYLSRNRPDRARPYFEEALALNPRLDVQKELGWVHLEAGQYPLAISLLSDHLHRHPTDYEAYNLLLQAYIDTERYEAAAELAGLLVKQTTDYPCFAANYYLALALQTPHQPPFADAVVRYDENAFIDYNVRVLTEFPPSHNYENAPTLRSKLLFQDFRFRKNSKPNPVLSIKGVDAAILGKPLITIGREGHVGNDVGLTGESVSQRHCVLVNVKDDCWLYDLGTNGTLLDGEPVRKRVPLVGKHTIRIGLHQLVVNVDKGRLV